MSDHPIVMYDSPDAAQPYTMEGWLSRNGRFYQDESSARYDGCTHRPCSKCGLPTPKSWLVCDACRAIGDRERYEAMPVAPWDGRQMLYSEARGRFFSDPSDAEDALDAGEGLDALRLVLCEPQYASPLDLDNFQDSLPDEDDAPDELMAAIDTFNAAVKVLVLSWTPGKTRWEQGVGE